MILVADTSALFVAFDADQAEHEQAVAAMERETLVISPLVLTELDHLTRRDLGFAAAVRITDALLARAIASQRVRLHMYRPTDDEPVVVERTGPTARRPARPGHGWVSDASPGTTPDGSC